MAWRVLVEFPEMADDRAMAFTHRVGNLQEDLFARLSELGGSMSVESLDRVGYSFSIDVKRKRDLNGVLRFVEKLAASHIPDRDAVLSPIEV